MSLIPVGHSETIECDGKCGGSYLWKGHDFAIMLPPCCADEKVKITLQAYLPSATQAHCLVSAAFDINSSVKKFKKPIRVRFPHWVNIESEKDKESLHFLICHMDSCEVKTGYFEVGTSFGYIELLEFCPITIIFKRAIAQLKAFFYPATTPPHFPHMILSKMDDNISEKYADMLLSTVHQNARIYCITKNLPTCLEVIQFICLNNICMYTTYSSKAE